MAEAAGFQFAGPAEQREVATLGMWAFLSTETLFFGALIVSLIAYRLTDTVAFAAAGRHTDVVLGTINTFVLLTSSAAMAFGVEATKAGRSRTAAWALGSTVALGLLFIGIKVFEWSKDWGEGLVPAVHWVFAGRGRADEIFMLFYFTATGIHALHMVIGVSWIGALAWKSRGAEPPRANVVTVAGLYWHFVDIVWIFLFPLLYLNGREV